MYVLLGALVLDSDLYAAPSPIDLDEPPLYEHPIEMSLPHTYIKIIPHPHSNEPTRIISLSHCTIDEPTPKPQPIPVPDLPPYAPFRCHADYSYTKTAVDGQLPDHVVNAQLQGLRSSWAEKSKVSFETYGDMKSALDSAARHNGIMVSMAEVTP